MLKHLSLPLSVFALVPTLLTGCEAPDVDRVAAVELESIQTIPVDVGVKDRAMKLECRPNVCLEWAMEDTSHGLEKICMRYGDDCDYPKRVTLHAGASEAASNAYFPAYNDIVTNNLYRGCGPRAALNVLSYFDVATNIYNVWGPVPTIDNPFNDQRATLPDDLRSGLESLLNSMGKGHFRVKRISGQPVAKIKNLLTGGYPVIALVNNGGHYVTFTGYENGKYRVTDYYGSDRWVAENDIDIGFRNFPAWFSFISTGTGGYKAGTLLYVERDNVCQCSGAGTTAHGSNGCTKTCDGCWWGACYGGNHDDPPPPPGGQPF